MEIPVINRITDFDAGITTLQNPPMSLVPKIFALSSSLSELIHQASSFWKWGALIIALLASFTTVIGRIKIFIIRFQTHHLSSASQPLLVKQLDYDSDVSSCYSSSSEVDDDDEEEEEDDVSVASCSQRWTTGDEDFRVKGSSGDYYADEDWENLFSWPEFPTGKNVVSLWDNLGFEMIKQQNICSIFGGSPSVAVSAETSVSGNLLKVWDTRVGCRIPQILAEWKPRLGRIVGVHAAGGIEKIYVTDDAITGGLTTVADGRKLGSPLVNAAETGVDTWWDADAVIVGDESVDESPSG